MTRQLTMREPVRSPALTEVGTEDMRHVRGGEQTGGPANDTGHPQIIPPPPPTSG